MMEFLVQPVPMWLFLLPFLLLMIGGLVAIFLVKTPRFEDPPHP